jgi:hypothetical protein
MILALAALLVCTSMLLIYAILCRVERRLERRQHVAPPSRPGSKVDAP